jgi:1-acyl-sn-glycerol-3-phosphate acyltransferase
MGQVLQVSSEDVFVSWLPLYNDMGLIGAWLGSLYYAYPLVVMSPLTFLARPERWLWAVHRHRGTLSGGPNFGYELCLRKLDEATLNGLDLSSWRFAFNGAEPVSATTMLEFQQRFARYGLRPQALAPVYGLAETSLGLTFPPPGRGLIVDRIDRQAFSRSGRAQCAAAGVSDVQLVVACGQPLPGHEGAETRGMPAEAQAQLRRQINIAAVSVLGAPPDDVVLVPPHTVLKTSSGKIRRAASRELYESGGASSAQSAPWRQIARFAWQAMLPQLRRARRVGAHVAYAGHVWLVFWLLAPITWGLAAVCPKPSWSWALSHHAARLFLRLSGLPFAVEGLEHLPREATCVVVANHASYLDGITLVAALPRHVRFVAKRALQEQFVPRVYLRGLGAIFVDRDDAQRGAEDVARVTRSICAGASVLFFPEGTFRRVPGLCRRCKPLALVVD